MLAPLKESPLIDDDYKPNRNIVKNMHKQAAFYLALHYGYDYQNMLDIVTTVFIPDKNGFKEAKFKVIKKDKVGDRNFCVMTAREYFATAEENNWHLSPSLVAYTHSDEKQSVNAFGTDQFIEFRRLYKGKMKDAKSVSDKDAAAAYNEIQNALKIFNNAQSGGMSSSGTPLFNKSGHTSLTSTTRSLTGTANILNERFITGNRLLLSYNKTMELFISTLTSSNRELIQSVIEKYKMNYATLDQIMDMVKRCANYYWNDPAKLKAIEFFVQDLSPLDKTVLLCTMDLRGLYVTNPELMKEFFNDWCKIPEIPDVIPKEALVEPANVDYKILCVTKLGKGATKEQINYLNAYHVTLELKWDEFMRAFFRANIPPSNVFSIKEMIRENVVTSDTDSSIYSVDLIVDDYVSTKEEALSFNGVLTYFIRCIAVDQHLKLSRNMRVSKKYERRLNMKNEYLFSSYLTTMMSKHYCALQLMLEGILNDEPKLELKGVHLRGIKIALKVREFTKKLMHQLLNAIYNKQQLDAAEILKEVADMERALCQELQEGGYSWLTKNTIKDETAYTKADSSIYYYHELWEAVFADTYGEAPVLPYKAYKINLDLSNKTRLKNYLESIKDSPVGIKLAEYLKDRAYLTSVYVPSDKIGNIGGIPKEILPIIDSRLIIAQNLKSIYVILEALGIYMLNSKITRLCMDEH